jgi:hypothetical protein
MSFPIRIKLIHKETKLLFKEWAIKEKKSDNGCSPPFRSKFQLMPCINEDGNPYYVDFEQFYLSGSFLSPKDWELHVATKKDDSGKWIYERIGY